MTLATLTSKRIAIVRQYKSENPDSNFPSDRDLDAEVPGSAEVIERLARIVEASQQAKERNGGTIGITWSQKYESFGVFISRHRYQFGYRTAKEAAAEHDRRAIALYGEDAVLNDPDAVDTLELDVRDAILFHTKGLIP